MKKWAIVAGIFAIIAVAGLFFIVPNAIDKIMQQGGPAGYQQRGGPNCNIQPGEWVPEQGDCPGEIVQMQDKCNEFCVNHPDCCGDRAQNSEGFGGREEILPLPSESEVLSLERKYPAIIKALNEGPNIYSKEGKAEIMSDSELEEIKAVGFNTIQVLLIGKKENGKLVFNEANNAVLLNDIVAIKKHGIAVWVALDIAGGKPGTENVLGGYSDFKSSFSDFTRNSAELMEKYKIEYLTTNNEPDKTFKEQKEWSTEEINNNLADFFPATNAVAREKFSGKLINKITQTKKHAKEVVDASFKNVDIAGVDVGPPMDGRISLEYYKIELEEYQFYASLAEKAGVPWMNAEYWQGDFQEYSDFAKSNELEYAQVSFDAYLKTTPKGAGYVWNDLTTFSLPQGEETKQALKEFLSKI